ncbi:RrF2 family transcriptional regulator [Kurthia sibirica]|uniref:Transcriptional regulator n=1 Tax=Kurthia sibirica TaxID=202750 RepID=A0A2U3AJL8_9BACL|nr:Rrf2 family transcriptional regulator [Kurthia sibirica]PWI24720.1 transcriptional regulator [Kurthia sibirica]GEK34749.1 Rrf2 family transcriptional regulator [Kurthia sibirica]
MQMKTGVEQSLYAILLLNMLPDKAVLPAEAISTQLRTSQSYFQKMLRKLVSADLIQSVPGIKGGFKLKKKPQNIRVYDIYVAIEGQQSLYTASGVLDDMLDLDGDDYTCLMTNVMHEAENSWQQVLKRETVASIYADIEEQFNPKIQQLKIWLEEHMVRK